MRLYVGQIVYVKKEHLEDFLPNGFAEKYDSLRKRSAKVLEWKIDVEPGKEDPMMVQVQMLEDGEIWVLPSRMIYCLPESDKITIDYKKIGNIVADAMNVGYCSNKYTKSYEQAMAKGEFKAMKYAYKPLKIIYNDPATIVFWRDGTKTVVKRMEKEKFNPYTAFCAALAKKLFGSNSAVNRIVNSGYNQLVDDILKAGKKAKPRKKLSPNLSGMKKDAGYPLRPRRRKIHIQKVVQVVRN